MAPATAGSQPARRSGTDGAELTIMTRLPRPGRGTQRFPRGFYSQAVDWGLQRRAVQPLAINRPLTLLRQSGRLAAGLVGNRQEHAQIIDLTSRRFLQP